MGMPSKPNDNSKQACVDSINANKIVRYLAVDNVSFPGLLLLLPDQTTDDKTVSKTDDKTQVCS